jgi:rhodanese-related sulfurtransferase
MVLDLMPDEVLARIEGPAPPRVVDVRTPAEYACRHIPGALLMPMDEFAARVQELDPEEELVVVCEHGIRSAAAASYLAELGYSRCANMRRGMSAWQGPTRAGWEP